MPSFEIRHAMNWIQLTWLYLVLIYEDFNFSENNTSKLTYKIFYLQINFMLILRQFKKINFNLFLLNSTNMCQKLLVGISIASEQR